MQSRSKARIRIYTDFDGTLVRENTAALLLRHYLFRNPHHEPLHHRLRRAGLFVGEYLTDKKLGKYYECVRRIPVAKRHELLRRVPVSHRWLQAVKQLRMRKRAKEVGLVIVTRNSVDIVHDWVMQNHEELRRHHVTVEAIVANGPLVDRDIRAVRERAGIKRYEHIAFGQLTSAEKRDFLDTHAIYIGDADDELLRPYVQEFVRI